MEKTATHQFLDWFNTEIDCGRIPTPTDIMQKALFLHDAVEKQQLIDARDNGIHEAQLVHMTGMEWYKENFYNIYKTNNP